MNLFKQALTGLLFTFSVIGSVEGAKIQTSTDLSTGLSISAWQQFNGSDFVIQAATETAGGVWSSITTVTNPVVCFNSRNPQVAINDSGQCTAIWIGTDPILFIERIYGSMLVAGTWTLPQALSDPAEFITDEINLGISNSGSVKLTWSSYVSFSLVARALTSPTFGTWGTTIVTL